jgi:4-diphosphocytidyl-2-C-methyl-D-erythritol kinase
MPALMEEGRAKVNLTLRVVARRSDGYHDLESVVAFADCADRLTLTPGSELALQMSGPLAQACGATSDNLVLKAARLLAERVPDMKSGSFTLLLILEIFL